MSVKIIIKIFTPQRELLYCGFQFLKNFYSVQTECLHIFYMGDLGLRYSTLIESLVKTSRLVNSLFFLWLEYSLCDIYPISLHLKWSTHMIKHVSNKLKSCTITCTICLMKKLYPSNSLQKFDHT